MPYNTTYLERDLALRLGIPMYGADPKSFPLGTKTGSRRLFAETGVPHRVSDPLRGDFHSESVMLASGLTSQKRGPVTALTHSRYREESQK